MQVGNEVENAPVFSKRQSIPRAGSGLIRGSGRLNDDSMSEHPRKSLTSYVPCLTKLWRW